jgi:hypothetical protein
MKRITMLCSFAAVLLLAPHAHAQTNYVFSYTQCNPLSCEELGPYERQGSVFVSFNGTCTGGIVTGIKANAGIQIGSNGVCSLPYQPYALIKTSILELENRDACPPYFYDVSYVTETVEIYNLLGTTVYYYAATQGCDGSITGATVLGKIPC